jgi:hypothetical protein
MGDVPGATARMTMPKSVPLPSVPEVLGCRVAEMTAWPLSLSILCRIAISWFPPERNPPLPMSSI